MDAENVFDKIQYTVTTKKNPQKLGLEGNILHLIKDSMKILQLTYLSFLSKTGMR